MAGGQEMKKRRGIAPDGDTSPDQGIKRPPKDPTVSQAAIMGASQDDKVSGVG